MCTVTERIGLGDYGRRRQITVAGRGRARRRRERALKTPVCGAGVFCPAMRWDSQERASPQNGALCWLWSTSPSTILGTVGRKEVPRTCAILGAALALLNIGAYHSADVKSFGSLLRCRPAGCHRGGHRTFYRPETKSAMCRSAARRRRSRSVPERFSAEFGLSRSSAIPACSPAPAKWPRSACVTRFRCSARHRMA